MKRALALLVSLVILAAMFCTPAMAETAQYYTTQAFIDELDAGGVTYELGGINESTGSEVVSIEMTDSDTGFSYTIRYFFDDSLEYTGVQIWYVIYLDEADKLDVMKVCNQLNYDYKLCKFYVDETDNTVTCSTGVVYSSTDDIGWIVLEATSYIIEICEIGYSELAPYATN